MDTRLKRVSDAKIAARPGLTYDAPRGSTIEPQAQRVLRNTYLVLALTMVPTLIGAFAGMATSGIVLKYPMASTLVMLAGVIGLQYGISANRNNGMGLALLLLMTGILGWWLGPILNAALKLANGMQLVGYAAVGTGAIFFTMGAIAHGHQARLQFPRQVPVRRNDRAAAGHAGEHVPEHSSARPHHIDAGHRGFFAIPAL